MFALSTVLPCNVLDWMHVSGVTRRSMLYNGSDIIRDVEWVIFDEVHYVNDTEVRSVCSSCWYIHSDTIQLANSFINAVDPNGVSYWWRKTGIVNNAVKVNLKHNKQLKVNQINKMACEDWNEPLAESALQGWRKLLALGTVRASYGPLPLRSYIAISTVCSLWVTVGKCLTVASALLSILWPVGKWVRS